MAPKLRRDGRGNCGSTFDTFCVLTRLLGASKSATTFESQGSKYQASKARRWGPQLPEFPCIPKTARRLSVASCSLRRKPRRRLVLVERRSGANCAGENCDP